MGSAILYSMHQEWLAAGRPAIFEQTLQEFLIVTVVGVAICILATKFSTLHPA